MQILNLRRLIPLSKQVAAFKMQKASWNSTLRNLDWIIVSYYVYMPVSHVMWEMDLVWSTIPRYQKDKIWPMYLFLSTMMFAAS